MQRNYFSILFFIRRTRLLKNGEAPIGLRITVNGQRAEMQIKRSVAEERWNASKGCVIGKDRKTLEQNQYLESVRTKIYQIHRELLQDSKPITAFTIIQKFNGEDETPKMLLEVFREHNKKYRELIDRDYVKGTVLRYERTVRYLEEMLQSQYNLKDIPLKELSHEFVLNFEHFVKVQSSAYLQVPKIADRKPVFVSREVRDRLDEIVRRLGGRGMSVSGLVENIARQHFATYENGIEQWRKL